jgi:L,D-transpeptidase ErfK/SrfK
VTFVREPVKIGLRRGRVFVEIHEDEEAPVDLLAEAKQLLSRRRLLDRVDQKKLDGAIQGRSGMPVDVTAEPTSMLTEGPPADRAEPLLVRER